MCSITIINVEDGRIMVTMNRDESISRAIELPPLRDGELIYPKDSKANGTWFAASLKNGNIACLMNRYDIPHSDTKKSRGHIAIDALSQENFTIDSLNLADYNPFTLVIIGIKIEKYDYDGENLSTSNFDISNDGIFFTSSSYKWNEVLAYRDERFVKWQANKGYRGTIPKIHLDQPQDKEQYSVLMKRDESVTKSIVQAIFDPEKNDMEINYFYDPNTCFKKKSYHYELIS